MTKYDPRELASFATTLLTSAGMPDDRAADVAEVLVLALLPAYLDHLADGRMRATGDYDIVSKKGAVAVWDGGWLSGVWLTLRGLDFAAKCAEQFGIGAVAIRRSHHIACLAAYLPRMVERGLVATIASSDPSVSTVAPYGGLDPVFTPDPIAMGIPTKGDPVLIDVSSSITTNAMTTRLANSNQRMRGQWLQDHDGNLTDDPAVLNAEPPGSLLPTGGQDHGHKGYSMALMVESLTQGLSGYGRGIAEKQWGATTYIQVIAPSFFAGVDQFTERTSTLVDLCLASRPHPDTSAVRLPGQKAMERVRTGRVEGIRLADGIMDALRAKAAERGIRPLD
jgi:LDH2 family malate/lactate/ureidoglycolate dehydrogenase